MSDDADPRPLGHVRPPYSPVHRALLMAVTVLAGSGGGEPLTPERIATQAGLPAERFFEFFSDVESSLLAAHDFWVDQGARRAERPSDVCDEGDLTAALRGLIDQLYGCLADRPEVARLCLIQTPTTGSRGLAARDRAIDRLRGVLDIRLRLLGRTFPSESLTTRMVAGGIYDTAQRYTSQDRIEELPPLAATIATTWATLLAAP